MTDIEHAWRAMSAQIEPLLADVDALGLNAGNDEGQARTAWALLSAMTQYVVNFRNQDPANPQFTPLLNDVLNSNPVPDFTYRIARVSGDRRYVIRGTRGSTRFVEVQQMAGLDGKTASSGKALGRFGLDEMELGPGGEVEIYLGPPAQRDGSANWIDLDPAVTTLFVREGSYDWATEQDARLGIACLDDAPSQPVATPELSLRAMAELPAWAAGRVSQWTAHVRRQRHARAMEDLQVHHFAGGMQSQVYYEGWYEVDDDTAVYIESDVPETCLYWSVLLTDDRYQTIDWLRHQSSLNGAQTSVDPDGRFRAVLALNDPGCANWLDPGGNRTGLIQLRWNGSAEVPQPTLHRVALNQLDRYLHPQTLRLSREQRAEIQRQRRIGAQLRRRW